jgi:hypothetical protein
LRSRGGWFIGWCCGLIITVSGLGIWRIYQGISTSLQAETNLHYSFFALQLVESFVTEKGRWPRSWSELEGVEIPDDPGRRWPAVSAEMQQRIVIDFAVDPLEVAQQRRLTFTAIRPKGPYYEYRDYGYVDRLQDKIRKSVLGKKTNTASSPSK